MGKKKSGDILSEAIADAKKVKQLAVENARNVLVESLSDKVEKLISEGIDDVSGRLPDIPREADEEELDLDELPEKDVEEEAKDEELPEVEPELEEAKDEDVIGGEKETPETKRKKAAALEPEDESLNVEEIKLDEADDEDEDEIDEAKDEEEVSDDDIEEVYRELQLGEVDQLAEPDSKVDPEDHLEDEAKGEKSHEEQDVPAKKDFVPKEAYDKLKEAYNKLATRAGRKIIEHKKVKKTYARAMNEVNVLNQKLVAVARLSKLVENKNTKEKILEMIDQGRTIAEVKRLEKGARKLLAQLSESKGRKKSPLSKLTSNAIPSKGGKTVVNESAFVKRNKQLAGISKPSVEDEE